MTYDPNIPIGTGVPSQDYIQLQINFDQANDGMGEDHVKFDNATAADRGKHRRATFKNWVMPPEATTDPSTGSGEIALYAKNNAGASTLYLRQQNDGAIIQMSGAAPVDDTNGETFLPGGLIMKYGTCSVGAGGGTVDYTMLTPALSAFPMATYAVQLTPINPGSVNYRVSAVAASSFNIVLGAGGGVSFYFIAIGA